MARRPPGKGGATALGTGRLDAAGVAAFTTSDLPVDPHMDDVPLITEEILETAVSIRTR